MTIGQRIAQKRKEQRLSQESLGEKLGVSRQSVYKWESDAALPEIDKLIAMSRLFAVTVGWLLGVEESGAVEENAKRTGEEPGDRGDLTEAQLKMVQEIVDRYIAAQPKPPKRKRWPRVLAAVAVVVLVWTLAKLSRELNVLNSRYNNLQNSVSNISGTVSSQIGGIADRVEEILESQNSLLADHRVEIAGADLMANTLSLSARATPKTYTEGMTAVFVVDTGSGPKEYPATETAGHCFEAEIACPLTDETTVSVAFLAGDTRETQVIYTETYLHSSTFPTVYAQEHILMWKELGANGELTFKNEYAYIHPSELTAWGDGRVPRAEIAEIKVGFFKNRQLVTWLEPIEGAPDTYQGFDPDTMFYRLPDMSVEAEKEDLFSISALVIDEYDRRRLYLDVPYALNEDDELVWADSQLEKEDWYDESTWFYWTY